MPLLDKHSRFFVRHHVGFRPYHNRGVPLAFISEGEEIDVRTLVDDAIKKDRAKYEIRKDDVIRLTNLDVRDKDGIAIFLFRRSDPTAAAQVLENRKTRKLRPVDIGEDEAPAVSSHLFLDLSKQKQAEPTYRALLEEVPGLGRTYIQTILGAIIKSYRYTYVDKHDEEKETYTLLKMEGEPSDTLGSALKGSQVPYIELVRPGSIDGLDTAGLVVPREQRMRLVLRLEKPNQILGTLNKIKDWMMQRDWSEMRVRLDLPEDRSRLIPISRAEDAKDVLFIRSVPVTTKNPLPACTEVINEELVEKARALFAKKATGGK